MSYLKLIATTLTALWFTQIAQEMDAAQCALLFVAAVSFLVFAFDEIDKYRTGVWKCTQKKHT